MAASRAPRASDPRLFTFDVSLSRARSSYPPPPPPRPPRDIAAIKTITHTRARATTFRRARRAIIYARTHTDARARACVRFPILPTLAPSLSRSRPARLAPSPSRATAKTHIDVKRTNARAPLLRSNVAALAPSALSMLLGSSRSKSTA